MTVREIRKFGDPVLRTVCEPVGEIDEGVRSLVADLLDTVAFDGRAGLAATQIGFTQRAFSLNIDGEISYVLNPELVEVSGEPVLTGEGCLFGARAVVRGAALPARGSAGDRPERRRGRHRG